MSYDRLQNAHNEGQAAESEGRTDDWSTVIYRSMAFDKEEQEAFDAGVQNVRDQRNED